jgi:hypothetical protein
LHPQRRRLIHKLRADGTDDSGSVFGHTDFSAIAKRGLRAGANATALGQLPMLFDAVAAQDLAEVQTSTSVTMPSRRRPGAGSPPVAACDEQRPRRHAPGFRWFPCGSAADPPAQSVLLLIEGAMLGAGQMAVVKARHEALLSTNCTVFATQGACLPRRQLAFAPFSVDAWFRLASR